MMNPMNQLKHDNSGCGRKRSDPAMAAATAAGIERDNNGQIDQIVADKIRKDVDQERPKHSST